MKASKICVTTACFPAGTPVAVEQGYKNIEDIQAGDKVWSFNPDTGETTLKEVLSTKENEVDMLIQLNIGKEIIRSSMHHPFYSEGNWKDAGMLEPGDVLQNKDGEEIVVESIDYEIDFDLPEETIQDVEAMNAMTEEELDAKRKTFKVFNFEVSDWHTYFVGSLMALVHNVCLYILARQGVQYAQNILKGIKFNKIMQARITDGVHELWLKGMKARLDTLIPGKFIISRKATQLAEVTFDTSKKYIDELTKKYKSGKKNQNTERAGADALKGKYVLQVPKQNSPIPEAVKAYAKKHRVLIDIVEDAVSYTHLTLPTKRIV